jgi:cytochrome c2
MKTLFSRLLWIGLTASLAACGPETPIESSVTMEGDNRFAAEPVGLDTPAARCVVCHSIEKGGPLRVAPNLWGIVGAEKARFPWYGYSQALATVGGNWTEEDLDAYLADPNGFLPGTSKTLVGISDPGQRAKLIAYLATLGD